MDHDSWFQAHWLVSSKIKPVYKTSLLFQSDVLVPKKCKDLLWFFAAWASRADNTNYQPPILNSPYSRSKYLQNITIIHQDLR